MPAPFVGKQQPKPLSHYVAERTSPFWAPETPGLDQHQRSGRGRRWMAHSPKHRSVQRGSGCELGRAVSLRNLRPKLDHAGPDRLGERRSGPEEWRSVSTERIPSQYAQDAPRSEVANPIVRSLTPAMQLPGITTPKPISSEGTMNPASGAK